MKAQTPHFSYSGNDARQIRRQGEDVPLLLGFWTPGVLRSARAAWPKGNLAVCPYNPKIRLSSCLLASWTKSTLHGKQCETNRNTISIITRPHMNFKRKCQETKGPQDLQKYHIIVTQAQNNLLTIGKTMTNQEHDETQWKIMWTQQANNATKIRTEHDTNVKMMGNIEHMMKSNTTGASKEQNDNRHMTGNWLEFNAKTMKTKRRWKWNNRNMVAS